MPLRAYLQQHLSFDSLELVVDNASSPVTPISKPIAPRRRLTTLKRLRQSKAETSTDRWEMEATHDHLIAFPGRQHRNQNNTLSDAPAKLPTRSCSYDFSDNMINAIFVSYPTTATSCSDAAPTMPQRYPASVMSMRQLPVQ
jgi:hypothetical protein